MLIGNIKVKLNSSQFSTCPEMVCTYICQLIISYFSCLTQWLDTKFSKLFVVVILLYFRKTEVRNKKSNFKRYISHCIYCNKNRKCLDLPIVIVTKKIIWTQLSVELAERILFKSSETFVFVTVFYFIAFH